MVKGVMASLAITALLSTAVSGESINAAVGELNTTSPVDLNWSNDEVVKKYNFDTGVTTTVTRDQHGDENVTGVDFSSPSSVRQYLEQSRGGFAAKANAVVSEMMASKPETAATFGTDTDVLSNEYLLSTFDENSSIIRGTTEGIAAVKYLSSLQSHQRQIACYVKRKLNNSFYCPLPSRSQSYFIGGDPKTDKDEAKEECNDWCKEPISCISKTIDDASKTETVPFGISSCEAQVFTFDVDPRMNLQSLVFQFTTSGSPEDLTAVGTLYLPVDIDFLYRDSGEYVKYVQAKKIEVKPGGTNITLAINVDLISMIRVTTYRSHKGTAHKPVARTEDVTVGLFEVIKNYEDDKFWFCPETQFALTEADCDGLLVHTVVGGSPQNVCVPTTRRGVEPTYDAYYSESSCVSDCFATAECLPTYRHLTSLDTTDLDTLYDVEVGCMSGAGNEHCTEAECRDKYNSGDMPISEAVYHKDDTKVYTVRNSMPTGEAERPRFNISAELSSNGDAAAKDELLRQSEKDIAYANMVNGSTYNLSALPLMSVYPKQAAASSFNNNLGLSLDYIPQTDWIDSGKLYYFYVVMRVRSSYVNIIEEGTEHEQFDRQAPMIMFQDVATGLLHDNGEYMMLRLVEQDKGLETNTTSFTGTEGEDASYTMMNWIDMPIKKEQNATLIGDEYAAYSVDSIAPATFTKEFVSDRISNKYVLADSMSQAISDQEGFLIRSQERATGSSTALVKHYKGDIDPETASKLFQYECFFISSEVQLTYRQVLEGLTEDNLFFDSLQRQRSLHPLKDNGRFERDRVRLFMQGTLDNLSVYGQFTPTSNEESKEAFIYKFLLDQHIGEKE
ncbi:hypothetical protein ACXWTF_13140 [Thiomicrolovo sp. ZZH C-3]